MLTTYLFSLQSYIGKNNIILWKYYSDLDLPPFCLSFVLLFFYLIIIFLFFLLIKDLEKKDSKSSNTILNENLWEVLIKHVTLSNDINAHRICADAIFLFSVCFRHF